MDIRKCLLIAAVVGCSFPAHSQIVEAIDSGSVDGFSGRPPNLYDPIAFCTGPSFITAIQLFRDIGGMASYVLGIRYACTSIHDGSITIRKTDPSIPDSTNWNPFAASEPLDGPITKCDAGTFVSAIQGFKFMFSGQPGLKSPLSELGYVCTALNGGQTEVRRTDAQITEQFTTLPQPGQGWSGTLRPSCPENNYVAAIQGFIAPSDPTTAGDQSSQAYAELHFACFPPYLHMPPSNPGGHPYH
jgi:hypothetical protein